MNYDELTKEFLNNKFFKRPPMAMAMDMSRGEMGTLHYLNFEKDSALVGDIAKHLGLSSGRMASILKSLIKKNLITKKKSKQDARQSIISISEDGKLFIEKHLQNVFEKVKKLLEHLGEEDSKNYIRITKKICEYHKKECADDCK